MVVLYRQQRGEVERSGYPSEKIPLSRTGEELHRRPLFCAISCFLQLCQIILLSSTEAAHRPRFFVIPRLELSQWSILVSLQQVLRRPPLVVILAL